MQPLETEPAIFPDLVTTIREPSGRGLDPHVSTTVATAISSPAVDHSFSSVRTSRICQSPRGPMPIELAEQPAEVVERVQVMRGQKVVSQRERRGHAARERLVALGAEQWVQPDEAVGRTAQMHELCGQQRRVSAIPAIADHDHNSAVAQDATRPVAIERCKCLADTSAAAEIVHALADGVERSIQVAMSQEPGDPSEAGRENKSLEVLTTRDRVRKDHQESRVALH